MGIVKVASVIDHTIPARVYEDFYNTDNLVPVCIQCHSDITKHFDNRNAHEHFNNYKEIKYSGQEFRVGSDGFRVNVQLDDKLLSIPFINNTIPPKLENI
ncbi:HNH endonuclease [Aliarcobacter cryaerophilus]